MGWYAGQIEEFDSETRVIVRRANLEIVVLRVDGDFYAVENTCPHMGGPVGEGLVMPRVRSLVDGGGHVTGEKFSNEEPQLVCPWHGWAYDLKSGSFAGDSTICLRTYPTEVRDGAVYVRL